MAHNNTQHSHQERWECHEGQAHDQRPLPAVPVPDAANDESSHRTHYERSAVHREARDQARRRPPPAVVLTFGRGGKNTVAMTSLKKPKRAKSYLTGGGGWGVCRRRRRRRRR